jgi:hypothetical protein
MIYQGLVLSAERAGFEPAVPCGTQTFQACTFGHSDTSPYIEKTLGLKSRGHENTKKLLDTARSLFPLWTRNKGFCRGILRIKLQYLCVNVFC